MAEEELKKGVQFEGKEEYIKDVFTEIADYYDEMNEIMSMHMRDRGDRLPRGQDGRGGLHRGRRGHHPQDAGARREEGE